MARILSGVQPSGCVHLGNYFGAMKQHIELQEKHECFYFIANFHSLTTVRSSIELQRHTLHVAKAYLALGLDPNKATLYRQSDVPEIPEIALILGMVTGMGQLERCHAYKEKIGRDITPSVGLFYYPILMAADILAVQPDLVPVGGDQKQHIELTKDVGNRFNHCYGEILKIPEAQYSVTPKVYGTTRDGEGTLMKMSKSYGNTVEIFCDEKSLKKAVMGIETNSTPMTEALSTKDCLVYQMYKLFASLSEQDEMTLKYQRADYGFGHAKKELHRRIVEYFEEARERYTQLEDDYVEDVLISGALKARYAARQTLASMKNALGLPIMQNNT